MDNKKHNIVVGGEEFNIPLPTTKANAVAYLDSVKFSNIGELLVNAHEDEESYAAYLVYKAWHDSVTNAVNNIDFAPLNKAAKAQIEKERIAAEAEAKAKAEDEAKAKAEADALAAKEAEEAAKKAEEERKYYEEHIAPIEHIEAAKVAIDAETDEKILKGHIWNDTPIWLSSENQFNFKAAYDIAFQTNGMNIPITFKLGEKDGEPIFHTFETVDELQEFYLSCVAHINACLNEGWEKKDALTAE